ncbi:MAG: leucine-rich repeat protein, partial [Oscillospiraceae bacterium]|nr:leucine-rich repeat protein [Oscillospiraceae bacterium]
MRKKDILVLALALCMTQTALPVTEMLTASAADEELTFNELRYTIENGEVTISGFDAKTESVSIPSEIDGLPVTKIGGTAFYGSTLTSVTIPEGVTEIGSGAFWHSKQLTEVVLPS